MRFTVDKKELLQSLRSVQPAVARRSSLPVLQGIRLEATCGRLAMDTTDLELLVQLQMQVKTESGHGKAVVPFKLLEKAVKAMPDGDVTVSFEGSEPAGITVANGNKSATIEGLPLDDWPQMGPDEGEGGRFEYADKELASAMKDADSMRSEKATPARIAFDEECSVKVIEAGNTIVTYTLDDAKYFPNGVGPMEISFNPKFLVDGIKFVASERGVMWVKDASKPALITGDGDSRYVVMPVRLPS